MRAARDRRIALAVATTALLLVPARGRADSYRGTYAGRLLVVIEGPADRVDNATRAFAGAAAFGAEGRAPWVLFDAHAVEGDGCPDPSALVDPFARIRRTLVLPTAEPEAFGPGAAPARTAPKAAWDEAYRRLARPGQPPSPEAALIEGLSDQGVGLVAVEPDIEWVDADLERASARRPTAAAAPTNGDTHAVSSASDRHWPVRPPVDWHLDAAELRAGLALVESRLPAQRERVTIAHFDTGYMRCDDPGLPPNLAREDSWDFTRACSGDRCRPEPGAEDTPPTGRVNAHGHGTGTLGILAGGPIRISPDGRPTYAGPLGGAPFARVVEYRLAEFVAIWRPTVVASALRWAADHAVDVVSMSMGGPPSATLHDAVNEAYCRGVAVFAAAGNNFTLPLALLSSPRTTVFPARYHRVVAVGGVTSDALTYARAPWRWSYLLKPWTGVMRGNLGPSWVMDETLLAWTPNVPWLEFRAADRCDQPSPAIRLNGAGTSAATPQVAAAAAQWLQYHRQAFSDARWRSWEKTESVYRALLAQGGVPDGADGGRWVGKGFVRAATALRADVPTALGPRPRAVPDTAWIASAILSSIGTPQTLQDPALGAMFATEIAQLAVVSRDVDEALADRASERRALERIARSRHASDTLRAAARAALSAPRRKEH